MSKQTLTTARLELADANRALGDAHNEVCALRLTLAKTEAANQALRLNNNSLNQQVDGLMSTMAAMRQAAVSEPVADPEPPRQPAAEIDSEPEVMPKPKTLRKRGAVIESSSDSDSDSSDDAPISRAARAWKPKAQKRKLVVSPDPSDDDDLARFIDTEALDSSDDEAEQVAHGQPDGYESEGIDDDTHFSGKDNRAVINQVDKEEEAEDFIDNEQVEETYMKSLKRKKSAYELDCDQERVNAARLKAAKAAKKNAEQLEMKAMKTARIAKAKALKEKHTNKHKYEQPIWASPYMEPSVEQPKFLNDTQELVAEKHPFTQAWEDFKATKPYVPMKEQPRMTKEEEDQLAFAIFDSDEEDLD
jgi:hypothetical protein